VPREEITFEVCSQMGITKEELGQCLLADNDETGSPLLTDEKLINSVQVSDFRGMVRAAA
jgi:hypothetical protein